MARHHPFNDERWIECRWAWGKPTPAWLDLLHRNHPQLDYLLNRFVTRWITRHEIGPR